jgi:hypothetical protein
VPGTCCFELQTRYEELLDKRRAESLAPGEYEELQRLTDQVEMLNAKRVADLSELARLRQVPINELLSQLGFCTRSASPHRP